MDIEALAHRMAWRYKKSSDSHHSDTYTFNRTTLLEFARLLVAEEREECAALCDEVVTHPPGYGGQWEGYGPVKTPRDGKACAAAIRKRSNGEVRGASRPAGEASSREAATSTVLLEGNEGDGNV